MKMSLNIKSNASDFFWVSNIVVITAYGHLDNGGILYSSIFLIIIII